MINDHTDAEIARREHEYEMGFDPSEDPSWKWWSDTVTRKLIAAGVTTPATGLDGEETVDGFSLDYAYEAYEQDTTTDEYVEEVLTRRGREITA